MEEPIAGPTSRRTGIIVKKQIQVPKRKKTSKQDSVRHQNDKKRVQKFSPWMSYPAIFVFLIPCLIDVLQVNAQASNKSLFETHSTSIWIFLVAIFVYSFAFAIDRKSHHSQLLNAIGVISGSLSAVSLISIIVPLKLQHYSFTVCGSVSLIVVGYQYHILVKHAWFWPHGKIRRIVKEFLKLWDKFERNNQLQEQRLSV